MPGYEIADFLAYDGQIWLSLVRDYQMHWWPMGLLWVLCMSGLAMVAAPRAWPVLLLLLAACWAWIAWAFHLQVHLSLNWAAGYWAVASAVQSLLLFAFAIAHFVQRRDPPTLLPSHRFTAIALICGMALPAASGWLLEGVLPGHGELFGMTPDAVAFQTLIVLALLRGHHRGGLSIVLGVLPLLALAISGLFGYALGFLTPLLLLLCGFGAMLAGWFFYAGRPQSRGHVKMPAKEN